MTPDSFSRKAFSSAERLFNGDMLRIFGASSAHPLLLAIKRGLAVVLPLVMVGSFCLLLRNVPFQSLRHSMDSLLSPAAVSLIDTLIACSFGIASLALVCSLSAVSAMYFNQTESGKFVSPIATAVVSLACFFLLACPKADYSCRIMFSMDRGLLLAMLVGLSASALFLKLARIRPLQLPLDIVGHDPIVRDVFTVMPAAIVTILLFGLLHAVLASIHIDDVHDYVQHLLATPFLDAEGDLGFGVVYSAVSQVLWFFGAHGPNLLNGIETRILVPAGLDNAAAVAQGVEPTLIFTKAFFDVFTRMGGSGCTLSLILVILLRSQDRSARKLCLFAALPALFNVNEPLLFGIPLVLNPVYIVPFLLVPILQTLTAYAATVLDLVPHTVNSITWTTPALLSGYSATGSVSGSLLQGFNLMLGAFVYLPFVALSDSIRVKQGERVLHSLCGRATRNDAPQSLRKCIDAPGETGRLAKSLAEDLREALVRNDQLYLFYQPQLHGSGSRVVGVEALLRWRHPHYGEIPPPVTVALAEETGLIHKLGLWVLAEACEQRVAWRGFAPPEVTISVNISPKQLSSDDFAAAVRDVLRETGLPPDRLELEITESTLLEPDARVLDVLTTLQQEGIRVAIDDFGMGHASLRYIRAFPVNTIKIDRSLTDGDKGGINDQIAMSILELSRNLDIATVVEGVEILEQVERFMGMGFTVFQGYYFCRPMSGEDCLALLREIADGGE